jgi:membrane protease YdiL (CAAX protease family)
MTERADRAPVALYVLATFAVTWLLWWACARWGGQRWLFALGGPLFLVGVFTPGLLALAFAARHDGHAGVRRMLAGIARWSVPARLYLFALGFMVATRLAAAVVHRVARGDWPPFGDTPVPLMVAAIVVSTWVQGGEELGWRAYLLPRLARRVGLGGATVMVGVIWAAWHLPLFFIPGSGSDGQSFPLYLVHVTALSVAMGWLYWKSAGSLFVVMVMHASINNTASLVPAALPAPVPVFSVNGSLLAWTTAAVAWIVAAALLYDMRGARLAMMAGAPAMKARSTP